jgi:hypothetical protein
VRLYLDGKVVHEGTTRILAVPLNLPPSAVLGAEIFYFHDAYYRGLVGRTLIFDRAIGASDIAALAGRALALRGQEKPEIGELREEDPGSYGPYWRL